MASRRLQRSRDWPVFCRDRASNQPIWAEADASMSPKATLTILRRARACEWVESRLAMFARVPGFRNAVRP